MENLESLLQELLAQEEELQFRAFRNEDALALGMLLVNGAKADAKVLTVDICRRKKTTGWWWTCCANSWPGRLPAGGRRDEQVETGDEQRQRGRHAVVAANKAGGDADPPQQNAGHATRNLAFGRWRFRNLVLHPRPRVRGNTTARLFACACDPGHAEPCGATHDRNCLAFISAAPIVRRVDFQIADAKITRYRRAR